MHVYGICVGIDTLFFMLKLMSIVLDAKCITVRILYLWREFPKIWVLEFEFFFLLVFCFLDPRFEMLINMSQMLMGKPIKEML